MKKPYLMASAMLACCAMHAEIIYQDIIDETLTETNNLSINFDNAGEAEFIISNQGITSIEPGIMFSEGNSFVTLHEFPTAGWDVIKGLDEGTLIDENSGWHSQGDAYIDPSWAEDYEFPTNADCYIGTSFQLNDNTHYGWIRVTWDGEGNFVVLDFAYENSPNTPIVAGAQSATTPTVAITEHSTSPISIVIENDAITLLHENDMSEFWLQVLNVEGKLISETKFSGQENSLSTTTLASGIYIATVRTKDGSITSERFVKYE